ncbi:MAG TPA: histidinol dehydrogenase, partial [Burkholderiaceae bacterium]|nr:histidinol dehydrogenase [Burkholderiaceae bacterium]
MSVLRIARLATTERDFDAQFQRVLHWSGETDRAIEQTVEHIVDDVRARGDAALLEHTARLDGVRAASVAAL